MHIFLKENNIFIYKLKLCQSPVTHTYFVEVRGVYLDSVYVKNVLSS